MRTKISGVDNVLALLRDGWAIGHAGGPDGGAWMQKNGLGKGGESLDVNAHTFHALSTRGYLRVKGKRGAGPGLSTEYELSDKGRGA